MRTGLISDIHGNLHALDAVLARLRGLKVDMILCAGDLVCYGAHPNETIARMRDEGIPCVCGNYDFAAAWNLESASAKPGSPRNEPLKRAALAWTNERLTSGSRSYLRNLPWMSKFMLDGLETALFHAGTDALDEWLDPGTPEALRSASERLGGGVAVIGHTHKAFSADSGGVRFINPGAVGRSLDGDTRASFAVLDTETREAAFHRIEYGLEGAVAAIRRAGMPMEIALLVENGARRIEEVETA